jgi:hypothetical protein
VFFASALVSREVLCPKEKGVAEVRVVGVGRVVVLSGASLVVPMIVFETKKLGADERGSRHDAADKCGRGCRDQ